MLMYARLLGLGLVVAVVLLPSLRARAAEASGKPLGIVLFSWLAVRVKIALRPPDLSWRLIAGGGQLAINVQPQYA